MSALGDELAQQRRGSAPGSSRRARSSARRRSAASARRRAPSRSSRAAACRPRTGAGSPSSRSFGLGIPTWSSSSPARAVGLRRSRPKCVSSASRICRPIVSTGFRRRHRVLEDHRDLAAADLAQLARRRASSRSRPSKMRRAARRRGPARGRMPEQRERRDALAAARLADDAERLARRDVERDAVDGVDRAARASRTRRAGRSTASSGSRSDAATQLRVERLAQAVADQVEAEHREHDRDARG